MNEPVTLRSKEEDCGLPVCRGPSCTLGAPVKPQPYPPQPGSVPEVATIGIQHAARSAAEIFPLQSVQSVGSYRDEAEADQETICIQSQGEHTDIGELTRPYVPTCPGYFSALSERGDAATQSLETDLHPSVTRDSPGLPSSAEPDTTRAARGESQAYSMPRVHLATGLNNICNKREDVSEPLESSCTQSSVEVDSVAVTTMDCAQASATCTSNLLVQPGDRCVNQDGLAIPSFAKMQQASGPTPGDEPETDSAPAAVPASMSGIALEQERPQTDLYAVESTDDELPEDLVHEAATVPIHSSAAPPRNQFNGADVDLNLPVSVAERGTSLTSPALLGTHTRHSYDISGAVISDSESVSTSAEGHRLPKEGDEVRKPPHTFMYIDVHATTCCLACHRMQA